jgi:tetratricopeptide (TPR) repeat protein
VHLASKYPDAFRGLVLEGALTVITELPMVQQLALMMPNGTQLLASIPDIFQQEAKLRRCVMPVLVLHGEDDEIIPVRQGQALYAASAAPAALKRIRRFPNAGHNNLMERHHEAYLAVLKSFLNDVLGVSDPVLAARVQEHGAQEDISVRDAALRTMKTQADALIHKGEFEEACRKLTELLRLAPDGDSNMHAEACLQRAQCYLARGRRDECVDDCTTVLRLRPEDTIARTLRARCYWRMGLLSLALDDAKVLEQALLQCHGVDPVRARRLIAFSISLPSTSS